MGVWMTPWAEVCILEGNRFWFYSLVCSMFAGGMKLFLRDERRVVGSGRAKGEKPVVSKGDEDDGRTLKGEMDDRSSIQRRLVADGFDLLVPGSVTGWIPTSPAVVGFASAISTILSSRDIWNRIQG